MEVVLVKVVGDLKSVVEELELLELFSLVLPSLFDRLREATGLIPGEDEASVLGVMGARAKVNVTDGTAVLVLPDEIHEDSVGLVQVVSGAEAEVTVFDGTLAAVHVLAEVVVDVDSP